MKSERIVCEPVMLTGGEYTSEWWGDESSKKLHRLDGPAYIGNYCGITYKRYCILGIECSEKQFKTPGFIDAFIVEHS